MSTIKLDLQTLQYGEALIAPWGRTSSAFCTHRTRITEIFVKKSLKLPKVARYMLLKKKVHVILFQILMIHPKKYLVQLGIFQWDSLIAMTICYWSPFLEEYVSS